VLLSLKMISVWNQYFCYRLSISPIFLQGNRFNLSLIFFLKGFALGRPYVIIITVNSTIAAHIRPEIRQKTRWDGGFFELLYIHAEILILIMFLVRKYSHRGWEATYRSTKAEGKKHCSHDCYTI